MSPAKHGGLSGVVFWPPPKKKHVGRSCLQREEADGILENVTLPTHSPDMNPIERL